MDKGSQSHGLSDSRRSAHGSARILLFIILIFTIIFAWLAIVGATSAFMNTLPGTALLTLLAGATWVAMTAGLFHNGRRMRRVAWGTAIANVVMPIIGLFAELPLDGWSPWRDGGIAFWYVPTALAVATLVWLYHSSPARLAQRNG